MKSNIGIGDKMSDIPFEVIFDGEDVAFVNRPLGKFYWIIEKDKPIPSRFFDLQHDIISLIEERNELQFKYNMTILKNQSLKKENEQLKQEIESLHEQLAHFIGGD